MKTLPFICGKENEMSIQYLGPPHRGKPTVKDKLDRIPYLLRDELPEGLVLCDQYASNGARYYIDVGEHIEWATPECDSFEDVVAYELAGETVALYGLERLMAKDIIHGYRLIKRVTDSAGHAWGDHENYQIPRSLDPTDPNGSLQPALATFLAARSIWLGAGMVDSDGFYRCAQKIFSINSLLSSNTTRDRSLINTRDEVLDDEDEYRRLHLIDGDPNILTWSALMKVGMTAVLFRMLLENVHLTDLALQDPVCAAKQIASDPTGKTAVELENGKRMTAPELLEEFGARAKNLLDRRALPAKESDVINRWEWASKQWETCRDALFGGSDMVTKHMLYEAYKQKHPRGRKNKERYHQKLRALDLEYGIIGARYGKDGIQTRGAGIKLRQKYGYDSERAKRAVTEAPSTTRATLRAQAVRHNYDHINDPGKRASVIVGVSWDRIKLTNSRTIMLSARTTTSKRLHTIIERESGL